jgi:hypothetical protein
MIFFHIPQLALEYEEEPGQTMPLAFVPTHEFVHVQLLVDEILIEKPLERETLAVLLSRHS